MKIDIIRAWKDEGYRWSLSEEERHTLPENPVGELELRMTPVMIRMMTPVMIRMMTPVMISSLG